MIQINVFESIASDLKWSIANTNERLRSTSRSIFTPRNFNSCPKNPQKRDFSPSNVNGNFNMDNLTRDSKSISRSVIGCQENDLVGKKSYFRDLSNLCFGRAELNLLDDLQLELVRKGSFRNRNRKRKHLKLSSSDEVPCQRSNCKSTAESKSSLVSLIIERLRKDFQGPDNFVPRLRTLTNWKPAFFANWFSETDQLPKEPGQLILKSLSRCGPEEPTINSIGLKYKLSPKEEKRDAEEEMEIEKRSFRTLRNKTWLLFFQNRKALQTQSLHNIHKTCFSAKDPASKCDCILSSRIPLKSSKSISEMKIHSSHSFPQFGKNSRKIRRRREIQTLDDEPAKTEKQEQLVNFDKTSDDGMKNPPREEKGKYFEEPYSILSNESIILCEDTLSEKLKRDLPREELSQGDRVESPKNSPEERKNSPVFCETELRKLKNFEKEAKNYLQKDSRESDILKSIKTRIDDDFARREDRGGQNLAQETYRKNSPDSNFPKSPKEKSASRIPTVSKRRDLSGIGKKEIPKKKVSLIPRAINSVRPLENRLLRSKMTISSYSENSGWRNLNLSEAKDSPEKNLIESVDSGIHTDFSVNDQRTGKTSFRSTDDSLEENGRQVRGLVSGCKIPSFGSDEEFSWSDDESVSRKLREVVKRLTEELYQCEKRIKERIKKQNLISEETCTRVPSFKRRKKIAKPRMKRPFASSSDFLKNSSSSSDLDFNINIPTPSLSSFTDSEYEKSSS